VPGRANLILKNTYMPFRYNEMDIKKSCWPKEINGRILKSAFMPLRYIGENTIISELI
jgi:hypothetical protein